MRGIRDHPQDATRHARLPRNVDNTDDPVELADSDADHDELEAPLWILRPAAGGILFAREVSRGWEFWEPGEGKGKEGQGKEGKFFKGKESKGKDDKAGKGKGKDGNAVRRAVAEWEARSGGMGKFKGKGKDVNVIIDGGKGKDKGKDQAHVVVDGCNFNVTRVWRDNDNGPYACGPNVFLQVTRTFEPSFSSAAGTAGPS